ncbi:MAG: hypothetical protein RLZZ507_2347 [Cyanobacteriota bacterium]|jgi:hypothetical protein
MVTIDTMNPLKILVVRLLTAIFIISSVPTQSKAQLTHGYKVSINFPDTPNRGAPARSEGGGRRGVCDAHIVKTESPGKKKNDLIAVTPKNNVITTIASNPTVYVYIDPNPGKKAEFILVDGETDIYTTHFSLPDQAGIIKIGLPKSVKLQANKTYTWQLRVICEDKAGNKDKFVEGLIEPTSLTSKQLTKIQQLKQPVEQAKLYAEYGIWAELVDVLTSNNNPELKKIWVKILESVELKEVANVPIIDVKKLVSSVNKPG